MRTQVVSRVPTGTENHVVVLGWAPNAVDFVLVLRSKRLQAEREGDSCPIVFVTPTLPADDELNPLALFSDVYVIIVDFEKCFPQVPTAAVSDGQCTGTAPDALLCDLVCGGWVRPRPRSACGG